MVSEVKISFDPCNEVWEDGGRDFNHTAHLDPLSGLCSAMSSEPNLTQPWFVIKCDLMVHHYKPECHA